ncbi:Hypothetical protein SCF082_LOCUS17013 [Durusdinium trenchii]|uniref:Uncharacterized protein n=1 Tax=Durusdinium trenchii TaxID=1381693 RepID=A0ABP0KF65_9DINO
MQNPHLKDVLVNFPDVVPDSLPWPKDADAWSLKDLEIFIGSGGFLKPKKKAAAPSAPPAPPRTTGASSPEQAVSGYAEANGTALPAADAAPAVPAPFGFETPGFNQEKHRFIMPVRVHCEDTAPNGHVRVESLVAYAERIRSLALKQIMGISLADLKEKKLAILATEFVVEVVGAGIRVLDTLRVETVPEFPAAPLFPWDTEMFKEDGTLYMRGLFGLNLCQISSTGAYSGVDESNYRSFTKELSRFADPGKKRFSSTSLRFFMAYEKAGSPFVPEKYVQARYCVRSSDCDMYHVLFQARVPSMMESCHSGEASSFYVNIRMSVRPGDDLLVHVLSNEEAALFICLRGKEPVLTAVGRYKVGAMSQEEIKCASIRLPLLLKYCTTGEKPSCDDFDPSKV